MAICISAVTAGCRFWERCAPRIVRREYKFALVGYVVMPEHVHLLLGEPKKGTPSTVLQMRKQRVSRKLRKTKTKTKTANRLQRVRLLFPELTETFPQFWQARFYDFNVYSDRKRREKLDYMHRNPVTRKLVQRPQDWPWSSYLSYERGEAGLIPIDPI